MRFIVIDKKTGKEADEYEIALKEDWAKNLAYCDMEGFALLQDGTLILVDECGRFEYCPDDRFEVVFDEERPQGKWARHDEWVGGEYVGGFYHVNCPCEDGYYSKWETNFCPNCGQPMMKGGAE